VVCARLAANVVAALRGRGLTKVRAGYTLENQHKSVCGHTPPLSQNRSLGAGVFILVYVQALYLILLKYP